MAFLVYVAVPSRVLAQQFVLTPGIGHDRFTEMYFLEDSSAIHPDSLERIKRTEDGLRETYLSLGAAVEAGQWRIETTQYATDAAWRNISDAWNRWQSRGFRLDGRGRLEWKGKDNSDTLASSYTLARLEARPRQRISGGWSAVGGADWESVTYHTDNPYTVDYARLRGQVGVEFVGDMLEFADVRVGIAARSVPDSIRLEYTERFVRVGAAGWRTGPAVWSGDFQFTDREYDPVGRIDDHQRWWTAIRADYYVGLEWRIAGIAEWQYWNYEEGGLLKSDFTNWRVGGGCHFQPSSLWEIGGEIELRLEKTGNGEALGSDYSQWRTGPVIRWTPTPAVWLEGLPRVGHRSYASDATLYDSYSFWEIAAQGDFLLRSGPSASLLVSFISESHEDPARDIDQIYVSLVARYPIRP